MTSFRTLDTAEVKGKRVLIRVDLNVPMKDGVVTDDTRIRAILPTIREVDEEGRQGHPARPFRPAEGRARRGDVAGARRAGAGDSCSARPSPSPMTASATTPPSAIAKMADGDVLLLENTRFHKGEEKNDPIFVAALAELGDLYVNDAFSAAHRAHASTEGVAHMLPAYAGRSMQAELEALEKALTAPKRPVIAIVGGAKVSSKIDLLENLVDQGRRAGHRRRHGQHLPERAKATMSASRSARRTSPTPPAAS